MNIKSPDVDYEKLNFEEMDANPYEIVIAVSKKAREINGKIHKYLGLDSNIKPINLALKKLESDDVHFVYNEEEAKASPGDPSINKE